MTSILHPVSTSIRQARVPLLALALAASIGAAQAQSSYTLTKLSEPFLGKLGAAGQIDSQNRVTATVYYVSGYSLYKWGAPPGYNYTSYVSRWAASTAASVSPSKLISQSDNFRYQSPDGNKVFASSDKQYYDTVKRQFVTVPMPIGGESWFVNGINDSGAMAGTVFFPVPNQTTPSVRAVRWMPGAAAPEVLPIGNEFNHARALFINQKGAVVGQVGVVGSSSPSRTAIWRESGAFEVLNSEPDTTLTPMGITDSGDVLVWITKANTPEQSHALISHGVATTIAAPNPGESLSPTAINAVGVVVGTINQPSAPEGFRDRGFIWKDGVLTDLTAWVTAKGLKLPQGTVISVPWQINAQGSILATTRDASGKTTLVRLTAKP